LFRTAVLRNRLVRFLAGPPHTPRGKPGPQCRNVEFVSYENDYIADLSMQRIGLKLIVNTTTKVDPIVKTIFCPQ